MQDFVTDLPEGQTKRSLERALNQKKPFSHFKRALDYMSDEIRKKWFASHDASLLSAAQSWLADEGIEAELY